MLCRCTSSSSATSPWICWLTQCMWHSKSPGWYQNAPDNLDESDWSWFYLHVMDLRIRLSIHKCQLLLPAKCLGSPSKYPQRNIWFLTIDTNGFLSTKDWNCSQKYGLLSMHTKMVLAWLLNGHAREVSLHGVNMSAANMANCGHTSYGFWYS